MEIDEKVFEEVKITSQLMKGWIKFLGITTIVLGAISVFSIWGIIIAWLPIWQGVLLIRAANGLEVVDKEDPTGLLQSLKAFRVYFVIQGILLILSIVFIIVALFTIGVTGFSHMMRGGLY